MKIGTIYTSLDLDIDKVIKALEKEKRREQRKLQQQKDNEPDRAK